jgi:hypothetical protein
MWPFLAPFLLINQRSGKGALLETPVEFRVEPRPLRVLVPSAESG